MADSFDAYYKWLGIPPEEQPPNLYRLLGVRAFEADGDVIANAADQRMTHVRTFQAGKHSARSQAILNEISTAKLCLLHAARKADYDRRLRGELAARQAVAAPPTAPGMAPWPPGAIPGAAGPRGMAFPIAPGPPGRPMGYPVSASAPRGAPVSPATPAASSAPDELGQILEESVRRRSPRQQKKSFAAPVLFFLLLLAAAGGIAWKLSTNHEPELAAGRDQAANPKSTPKSTSEAVGHHEAEQSQSPSKPELKTESKPDAADRETTPAQDEALDRLLMRLKSSVTHENMRQTVAAGGEDGELFKERPKGELLVGLILHFETKNVPRPILCGLAGIYATQKGDRHGQTRGGAGDRAEPVRARPGYSLAGLEVIADDRVRALRLEFHPVPGENLLKSKDYRTSLIGERGSDEPVRLGGNGRQVIGLFGSATSTALSSVGLYLAPEETLAPDEAPVKKPKRRPGEPLESPPEMAPRPDGDAMPDRKPAPIAMTPQPSRPLISRPRPAKEQPRLPVPSADEQAKSLARIHDLFKAQYAEIRSAGAGKGSQAQEKRFGLAEKLFHEGEKTQDDLAARYVLLDESRKLAIQAGDSQAVLDVILAMASRFTINDVKLTLDSFTETDRVATPPAYKKRLAENALMLMDKAVQREMFDVAEQFDALAYKAARLSGDSLLVYRAGLRKSTLAEQRRAHDAAQIALQTLAANPDDPAANAAAGRYRCFFQSDWTSGLPLLARGDDAALAQVAAEELTFPIEPAERVKLGESWLQTAEADEAFASHCKSRARQWFEAAVPELSGVTRRRVVKQIEDLLAGHGLTVEYFEGAESFEKPLRQGVDAQVDMNFEVTTPEGVPTNSFTARWTGWLAAPPRGGQVAIIVEHSLGAPILWLDNKLLIDAWNSSGKQMAMTSLPTGKSHRLKLEYFSRAGGRPMIALRWAQRDGFAEQPIGPEALFQEYTKVDRMYGPLAAPRTGPLQLPVANAEEAPGGNGSPRKRGARADSVDGGNQHER